MKRRILWALGAVGTISVAVWLLFPLTGRFRAVSEMDVDPVLVYEEVQLRTLLDDYVTRGTVVAEWTFAVRVGGGGVVTALFAEPAQSISPGTVLATINDRPVVAIDLRAPFWRPLRMGDKGPDVLRLQEMLQSEGLLEAVDSSFGTTTKAALITWQELRGYSPADGVLMPQDLAPVPTGGVVLEVSAQVGTSVDSGSILYVLGSESNQITASIPPGDVSQLKIGDPASITLANGQELLGEITEIGASTEELSVANGEPSIVIPITIQPFDGRLLHRGENLRVTIILQLAEDVPSVPLLAITTDATGSPAVRIRATSGAIEVRPVELGLVDSPWVEILSGVAVGDFVVVGEE